MRYVSDPATVAAIHSKITISISRDEFLCTKENTINFQMNGVAKKQIARAVEPDIKVILKILSLITVTGLLVCTPVRIQSSGIWQVNENGISADY